MVNWWHHMCRKSPMRVDAHWQFWAAHSDVFSSVLFCPFGTFSVCRLFCLLLKVHVSQSFGSKIQDFFQTFSKTKIIISLPDSSLSNKGDHDKQRPLKNTGIKLFSWCTIVITVQKIYPFFLSFLWTMPV